MSDVGKSQQPTEPRLGKGDVVDAVSMERLQKLIALETSENATKSIIDRGKWMVGGVAALLAALGISTYADINKKIETISSEARAKVQVETASIVEDVKGATSKLKQDLANEVASIQKQAKEDTAKLKQDLAALEKEMSEHGKRVVLASERTIKEIEETRTIVSTRVVAKISAPVSRSVFDAKGKMTLPGDLARSEGQDPTGDSLADAVYDHLGVFARFWKTAYGRDSFDGRGGKLKAIVRYGKQFNNSFSNEHGIVIGDGDGKVFKTFTNLKIIAAELTHAVTQTTAGFVYQGQSGALNNHISDVFAVLVEQWHLRQSTDQSNWLIGDGIFAPNVKATALRSLKAPGSAYDDPVLGKDPQPRTMAQFVQLPNTSEGDHGGVHINSGIPNHAFYLAATKIGGYAWEAAGHIWYEALLASSRKTDFRTFAETTLSKADQLYGKQSKEWFAVRDAWREVGIQIGP
jgi:Thermolysin metallopeptidase, alpha-helical domain/Thermolysin metallopeptidase, catalytic domain